MHTAMLVCAVELMGATILENITQLRANCRETVFLGPWAASLRQPD